MARMIDLNITTYWWVPAASITDPSAVSAALLTADANISRYVHASTRIQPTNSDTVSEKSITDVANAVIPTVGNYEGNLVLFRDMVDGAPTANDPLTTIAGAAGVSGWIVRREGIASSAAAAAAEVVEAYLFTTDNPQRSGGTGDGYLKATIPLHPGGSFDANSTLVI